MVTKIEEKVYPFKNQSEGVDDDIFSKTKRADLRLQSILSSRKQ
jgi:hypothetical protein